MATMTFQEYVMTQDPYLAIDHNNWGSCVVGCYFREILEQDPGECDSDQICEAIGDDLLYQSLNFSGRRLMIDEVFRYNEPPAPIEYKPSTLATLGDVPEVLEGDLDKLDGGETSEVVDCGPGHHSLNLSGHRLVADNVRVVVQPPMLSINTERWYPVPFEFESPVLNTFGDIQKYYRRELSLTVDESELK